jgi:thiamine kinase-like enzyme
MSAEETPLTGGRITAGVVRVGDTVRRPVTRDRTHVHGLLLHLEERGFDAAPRFLGVDDQQREVLSFIPGHVPDDLGHFDDAQLAAAARLLRRFHDATSNFPLVLDAGAEVMCHNDWGPPNAVFRDRQPCGMIDFDTIAPGLRLWDLGYFAFAWLDLGDDDYMGDEQIRRLEVVAQAYGMAGCTSTQIAIHALARQTALAAVGRVQGKADMAEWAAAAACWTVLNVLEQLSPTGYALPTG